MSVALARALFARLAGVEALSGAAAVAQSELAGLLATDPDTDSPAVYFGNKSAAMATDAEDNPIPVYPCITFRPNGGSEDRRFGQESGAIGRVLVEFEFWEDGAGATPILEIAECVERLLDMRRGVSPALSLASGVCFHSVAFAPLSVLYDADIHAWAGLIRYEFVEARF